MADADNSNAQPATFQELAELGIDYVQIETPDINGRLRGKLTQANKALSEGGSAFSTILYGFTEYDDVCESRFSSFANGFPDGFAVADASTLRIIDPDAGVAAVICDMLDENRQEPYVLAPRGALCRAVERAETLGFKARFAVELEFFLAQADDELVLAERHHDHAPFGRMHHAYSLPRLAELRSLAAEFMMRMQAIGIPIETFHSELGYGMFEIAISHLPALEAADACARVKLYLKDFLAERGLVPVYMSKWRYSESGCGGHTHQSLWRGGKPAFAAEDGSLSEVAKHYLAGQLASLAQLGAVFYPTINSYRRMDIAAWAPENATWGIDNRTCALRAITQPKPESYRIEHRCPGADINPYLAITAMLASGLHGIEEKLPLRPAVEGNAADDKNADRFPRSLHEATRIFRDSEFAEAFFGAPLVEQYAITREEVCRQWDQWQIETITAWELRQYFDSH